MKKVICTTCAYCGVGCGIEATILDSNRRLISIKGDEKHPSNLGRLCSKGAALADTMDLKERLLDPEMNGKAITWNKALTTISEKFKTIIAKHGPNAVAFYLSGQLLTEDYYVANKLMKGFIGSANVDTNSRLCMSSPTAAQKRAFGADTVPGCYDDFEQAELIVLTGSNTAWCHPIVYQRIKQAKENNPKIKVVVIDPRKTDTCAIADLHLPIQSGTDAYLFNGLLANLANQGTLDLNYLEQHTQNFGDAIKKARLTAGSIQKVAAMCKLNEADVSQFYQWFNLTKKTVTAYSQGINQSISGTDKVNSIINCHLATGRIGKPGTGPFSLTGQPNAMGGREVGGLANQLAAHMDFDDDNIDRVSRFWNSQKIATKPGLKAVDMFNEIERGNIKAVWIMATSPVDSLPNANHVKEALKKCEFVIVSDCVRHTDTTEYADISLPALGWGEKDGIVTNSERRVSRQKALLPAPGNAKADWWIITQVAQYMGFKDAFNFTSPYDIFLEHARLSAFENTKHQRFRDFNLEALSNLSHEQYNNLKPVQWPITKENPSGTARLFQDGLFFTETGKANMISITPKLPANPTNEHYTLVLNTGRIRDQWHTMSRTSLAPQLNNHKAEPFIEIHPDEAHKFGIENDTLVVIESEYGRMIARSEITSSQKQGHVFVPMHWTEQLSSQGRVGALVNPVTDPLSGQPESKHTPVKIRSYAPSWYGFVLSRRELNIKGIDYVVKIRGQKFFRYEIATEAMIDDLPSWARTLLCDNKKEVSEWMEYADVKQHKYRGARFLGDHLESCLFITSELDLPTRGWLAELFNKHGIEHSERMALLSGMPPPGQEDRGKTICACYGVGENTIRQSIKEKGLSSVTAIGDCLNAGTNCGSCIPEIEGILKS